MEDFDDTQQVEAITKDPVEGIIVEEGFRQFILENSANLPKGFIIFAYYQFDKFLELNAFGEITVYQFTEFLFTQIDELYNNLNCIRGGVDDTTFKLILKKFIPEMEIEDDDTFKALQKDFESQDYPSLNIQLAKLDIGYLAYSEDKHKPVVPVVGSPVFDMSEMILEETDPESTKELIPASNVQFSTKDLDRVSQAKELSSGFTRFLRNFMLKLAAEREVKPVNLQVNIDHLLADIIEVLQNAKNEISREFALLVHEIDDGTEAENLLRGRLLTKHVLRIFPGSTSGAFPNDAQMFIYKLLATDFGALITQMKILEELVSLPPQLFGVVTDTTVVLEKALNKKRYFREFKSVIEKKLSGRPSVQEAIKVFLDIAQVQQFRGMAIYFLGHYICFRAIMEEQIAFDKEEGTASEENIDYSLDINHLWEHEVNSVQDLIDKIVGEMDSPTIVTENLQETAFDVFYTDVGSFLEQYMTTNTISFLTYTQAVAQIFDCKTFLCERIQTGLNV